MNQLLIVCIWVLPLLFFFSFSFLTLPNECSFSPAPQTGRLINNTDKVNPKNDKVSY